MSSWPEVPALRPSVNGSEPRDVVRRRRALPIAAAVLLLLAAFAGDWLTGREVASSLFYVIAIMFGAWFVGRRMGLALALASVIAWRIAHRLTGAAFSSPSVLYWNMLAELSIYLITALAVAQTRAGMDRIHALATRLEDSNRALDRETRAVGDLQLKLLPAAPPALPGYAWDIVYLTSTRAGGDYYDFIPLADGRLVVLVADASGHGAPAAVLMAMTRVLLHTADDLPDRADRLLARLNHQLAGCLPPAWFVTACVAVLDPARGAVDYSLAGHPPPWIVRGATGTVECLPNVGGPPLGAVDPMAFGPATVMLAPGDTLVFHTDGLTESMSPTRDLFGEARLRESLASSSLGELAGMRRRVMADVEQHRGGATQSDDLTLLLLRRVVDIASSTYQDAVGSSPSSVPSSHGLGNHAASM